MSPQSLTGLCLADPSTLSGWYKAWYWMTLFIWFLGHRILSRQDLHYVDLSSVVLSFLLVRCSVQSCETSSGEVWKNWHPCQQYAVHSTMAMFSNNYSSSGAAGNFLCPASSLSANGFKTVMEIDAMGAFNSSKAVYEECFKVSLHPHSHTGWPF